jgi:hypothetical protein
MADHFHQIKEVEDRTKVMDTVLDETTGAQIGEIVDHTHQPTIATVQEMHETDLLVILQGRISKMDMVADLHHHQQTACRRAHLQVAMSHTESRIVKAHHPIETTIEEGHALEDHLQNAVDLQQLTLSSQTTPTPIRTGDHMIETRTRTHLCGEVHGTTTTQSDTTKAHLGTMVLLRDTHHATTMTRHYATTTASRLLGEEGQAICVTMTEGRRYTAMTSRRREEEMVRHQTAYRTMRGTIGTADAAAVHRHPCVEIGTEVPRETGTMIATMTAGRTIDVSM